MRTFDLTPLLRSSVGFDDLFRLTESLGRVDQRDAYPPYNIEKLSEDRYEIAMAVAGFSMDELEVSVKENELTVTGKAEGDEDGRTFLHRGIATRAFERTFRLADSIRVEDAQLVNGLLVISLKREIPEHKRPRKIEIGSAKASTKSIEQKAA